MSGLGSTGQLITGCGPGPRSSQAHEAFGWSLPSIILAPSRERDLVAGDPLSGTSIAAPRWPFATLAARSTLAIPTCPRGRRGQGRVVKWAPAVQHGSIEFVRARCIGPHASVYLAPVFPLSKAELPSGRCVVTGEDDPSRTPTVRRNNQNHVGFGQAARRIPVSTIGVNRALLFTRCGRSCQKRTASGPLLHITWSTARRGPSVLFGAHIESR
jgi:hypothetical protein